MPRINYSLRLCIFFIFCTSIAASGPNTPVSITPLTVDFPQIYLRCKITSSETLDLGTGSFQIREDGITVPEFSVSRSKARQYMTLLLDRSSSLEQVIGDVRRSAQEFVNSLPPEVKLSVVSFASDIDINQDFTFEKDLASKAISSIRSWGGTVLYDASCLAIEQLYYNSDPRDLRTLVLFTDGRDETPVGRRRMSTATIEDVLKNAVKQNIRILAVGLGSEIDEDILKNLARTTQGWYLHAPTSKELYGIYQRIAQRVRNEKHFGLSYISPEPIRDGRQHQVRVETTIKGETTVSETFYNAALDPLILRKGTPPPSSQRPSRGFDISQPVLFSPASATTPSATGSLPVKPPASVKPMGIQNQTKPAGEVASAPEFFAIPQIRDSSLRKLSDPPATNPTK